MNTRDPKLVALQFNEFITLHDIRGLSALMSDEHIFIDRDNNAVRSKGRMIAAWTEFFRQFPNYRNIFSRVESKDDLVVLLGFAYWDESNACDHAIWTARIENGLVAEWRIYSDTEEIRKMFGIG